MIVFHGAMGRNEETTQKLVIKSNYDESKKFPERFYHRTGNCILRNAFLWNNIFLINLKATQGKDSFPTNYAHRKRKQYHT